MGAASPQFCIPLRYNTVNVTVLGYAEDGSSYRPGSRSRIAAGIVTRLG
ncbi:hypothetical protein MAHJHV50_49590 [Mycobacterium avium subsp. hominissuis]